MHEEGLMATRAADFFLLRFDREDREDREFRGERGFDGGTNTLPVLSFLFFHENVGRS